MRRVKFREEAQRLNVPTETVVGIVEKLLSEQRVYGVIDKKNEEFIYYTPEEIDGLIKLLDSKRILLEELAEKLSLKVDQVRLIIDKLLNENRVKGLLTEDAFVPDSVITKEREEYKKTVERLTTLFSKGEISEQSYITAIRSLERESRETIPTRYEEEAEIPKERVVLPVAERYVEKKLTTSQITALVIIGFIVFSVIIGGIWWYSLPQRYARPSFKVTGGTTGWGWVTFTIENVGNANANNVHGTIEYSASIYGSFKYDWSIGLLRAGEQRTVYVYNIAYAGLIKGLHVIVTCSEGVTQEFTVPIW